METDAVLSVRRIVERYDLTKECVKEVTVILREALYRMTHLVHLCDGGDLCSDDAAFVAHVRQINYLQMRAIGVLQDEGVTRPDIDHLVARLLALIENQGGGW
jgi:hypothetical protein